MTDEELDTLVEGLRERMNQIVDKADFHANQLEQKFSLVQYGLFNECVAVAETFALVISRINRARGITE